MDGDEEQVGPAQPVPANSRNTTDLRTIANPALLKTVWRKHIRKSLRSARLRDFYLAQDPVQFAAYEWGLNTFIGRLSEEVQTATYTPEPAVVIRGAKSTGLTRPLAVLSPRDALLYRTIVLRAEPDLKSDLREWTGASIEDRNRLAGLGGQHLAGTAANAEHDAEEMAQASRFASIGPHPKRRESDDEEPTGDTAKNAWVSVLETETYEDDWFQVWLSKQGIVANICNRKPFVVESDVANFFTSVDLEVVREHLHSHTSLEKEAVRLCVSLVRRSLPHPEYADSPTMGLPQEGFDSSRAIAHSLLIAVDQAFDREGVDGMYSRFMDDFVVGADDMEHGYRIVARLQGALEPLGLYPNPAKTRVVSTDQFLRDSMADENAWLEEVENTVSGMETGPPLRIAEVPPELVAEITERYQLHCSMEQRPKRWDRVLRRYYTLLRRVGVGDFTTEALDHLAEFPGSATHILEYVRAFPMTVDVSHRICLSARDLADLYGDIPLLMLETIGSAPNELSEAERAQLCDEVGQLLEQNVAADHSLADRLGAAAIPLIAKFGDESRQMGAVELVLRQLDEKSHARIQAEVLIAGLGLEEKRLSRRVLPGLPWSDVLALRFLDALIDGNPSAVGVVLNLLKPQVRLMPNRYHVHTRPLMLLPIIKAVAPAKAAQLCASATKLLARNPERLADQRATELLSPTEQSG